MEGFIQSLSESRLISSKQAYRKFTDHRLAELSYLYVLGLRIMLEENSTREWAEHYASKTAKGKNFTAWRSEGTDLYNFLHGLVDEDVALKSDEHGSSGHSHHKRLLISPYLLYRWISSASISSSIEGSTSRLFMTLDKTFRITGGLLPALRRLVLDWPNLSADQRRLALTRLLRYLADRHAQLGDLYPKLRELAHQHGALHDEEDEADLADAFESATAGATGSANVATSLNGKPGGLGIGFDPDGHWRSIYPAPKAAKPKKTTPVIRRPPADDQAED